MALIEPLSKVINASNFNLLAAAFDITNFRAAGAPANSTLTADTPKGVLGGSVALAGTGDWQAANATHIAGMRLGLFGGNSEGNAFENSPAAASGVVPIYMGDGLFLIYAFESHSADSAYGTIMSTYDIGDPLYSSPFGLLTPELPSTMADHASGVDTVIANVVKVPTASDLELGIKLIV